MPPMPAVVVVVGDAAMPTAQHSSPPPTLSIETVFVTIPESTQEAVITVGNGICAAVAAPTRLRAPFSSTLFSVELHFPLVEGT